MRTTSAGPSTAPISYDTLEGPVSEDHPVVSQAEWLEARRELLKEEKDLQHRRDALLRKRRALPWVKISKTYAFDTPEGKKTLSDLFEEKSQLVIYHFMFGPGWKKGCDGCSFLSDHFDAARIHAEQHDVKLVVASRARLEEFQDFKRRMGWQFPWVSSHDSDFNYDFHVAWRPEQIQNGEALYNFEPDSDPGDEGHGFSVFYKTPDGAIYHTYSSYARGGEEMLGAFMLMDMTPKGRNESSVMSWIKLHYEY